MNYSKVVKEEPKRVSYKIRGQEVTGKTGSESPKEALGEGTCCVFQETKGSGW